MKHVLIVNSYHAGYPLSDEEMEGLRDTLDRGNIRSELFVEYLDAKRFDLKERFQIEKNLLRSKYGRNRPDIIIVIDDDAFDFMAYTRDELFAGIPVVFAGINDLKKVADIRRMNITGVVENPDYSGTLELALRIFPRIRTMTVVTDETTTGRAHRDAVRKIAHEFNGRMSIAYLSLGDMTFSEMKRKIDSLGGGDAVFLLSHFTDRNRRTMAQDESMRFLLNGADVPVFVITDTRVGDWTVGGCVVSGYAQGKRAGEIALKILEGISPRDIPVDMSGSNRYVFDYRVLNRFNVDFTDLPSESIFRNAPDLGYRDGYRYILLFISIVVPLLMVIIVLVVNVMMRRRAEKALKVIRDRYLLITNNMSDTIWMVDMNLRKMYLSPSIARNCGYSVGELWGMSSRNYISPASFLAARKRLGEYVSDPRIKDPAFQLSGKIEIEFMRKDGSMLLAETQINIMRDDAGNAIGFLGVGRDISDRRAVENTLMESERRMREMLENIQLLTVMIDSRLVWAMTLRT
ncbi:MAG TPA: ABC transporter substrate binding protein, partial [Spirochaetota bacterium]|nr:ABC transporter substrate binding protein [Spirochaetota bacterium]